MIPAVSAIITSYMRPDFVKLALRALAKQSVLPAEAVVSDDGSTANIKGAIAEIAPSLPFPVTFVTQPDKGFRAAKVRNNAIRLAKSDYLVFFDQDILGPPDYLKTFVENAHPGQFLVGYPVRLNEEQSTRLAKDLTLLANQGALAEPSQLKIVAKQWRKDRFYAFLHAYKLRPIGPKLRSGVFGAYRSDLFKVNGFDEEYQGWGNEDDDLGHRLHEAGIVGRNVFDRVIPFHLWHPSHNAGGERRNKELYRKRLGEIARGKYHAAHGVENPLGGDESIVSEFRP